MSKRKPAAIIVDIDGTVADKGERSPYDYSKVHEDTVIEPIRDLVGILGRGISSQGVLCYTLFVSGRSEECYDLTSDWLRDNGLYGDELIMRPERDYRPDEVVKREIYERCIEPVYDVRYVLDDRNKVVAMWRDLGLTVLQVADGDF